MDLPWTPAYQQLQQPPAEGAEDASSSPLAYWSLAATVAFTVGVYAWEGYLDARQRGAYQKTQFPKELQMTVSEIDKERAKEPKKKETSKKEEADDEIKDKTDPNKPLLPQLQSKFKNAQLYGMDVSVILFILVLSISLLSLTITTVTPLSENQLWYDCELL